MAQKIGKCMLCLNDNIPLTKSDIIPKWYMKTIKSGPNGGSYWDAILNKRSDKFIQNINLCQPCNGVLFSQWENDTKSLYDKLTLATEPLYGPSLWKFAMSMSWRVHTHITEDYEAADHMRIKLLSGTKGHTGQYLVYAPNLCSSCMYGTYDLNQDDARAYAEIFKKWAEVSVEGLPSTLTETCNRLVEGWTEPLKFTIITLNSLNFIGIVSASQKLHWRKYRIRKSGHKLYDHEIKTEMDQKLAFCLAIHRMRMIIDQQVNTHAVKSWFYVMLGDLLYVLVNPAKGSYRVPPVFVADNT